MKKLFVTIILLSLLFITALVINNYFQEKSRRILSSKKVYCYFYVKNNLRSAYMVESEELIEG